MSEEKMTSTWIAVAEAIAIVIVAIEEVIRRSCKKKHEEEEATEINIEIGEAKKAEKRE